jgi:hypothetical protein
VDALVIVVPRTATQWKPILRWWTRTIRSNFRVSRYFERFAFWRSVLFLRHSFCFMFNPGARMRLLLCLLFPLQLFATVHTTYHWHLQQPIYWPDRSGWDSNTYEKAYESIQRTNGGQAHPENNLNEIFSIPDRVSAYQGRPRDAIASMAGWDSGAQMSFGGCLAENVKSLGDNYALGYSPSWNQGNRDARSWTTSSGQPRLDVVIFPYHHSLAPLIGEEALRMEVRIAKDSYAEFWGDHAPMSQGFFPPELAFSERIIPVLVEEGIDWTFVPNNHISRACGNFPLQLGTGGENCTPPNKADQQNPDQSRWFSRTISRGCTPTNAVPFGFTPHMAEYVNPETAEVSSMVVVPVAQAMSWFDGYGSYGVGDINEIDDNSDPAHPQLVVLAHDGDNAWGGGYSYYLESVPSFTSQVQSAGHHTTVVQEYLNDYPVNPSDIVHVEDGAWVNADGDFGSPDFINWNWPLMGAGGPDIPTGWAEDERNWAVITAAMNRVITAEELSGPLNISAVRDPLNHSPSQAELAWHFFLPSLTSGYMYYGASLDMEVKATVACNEAVFHADNVIGGGGGESTPPSIWLPQQLPHNPGEIDYGPIWGYQQVQSPRDFYVWTFIYDVSGLSSVNWKWRIDNDGTNPITSHQNETFAGGSEVGAWQSQAMNYRDFPTDNVTGDPNINFFELPQYMADQYWLHVTDPQITDEGGLLIDYYIEAVDELGNVQKSPIQHTWIGTGDGGGQGGNGAAVTTWPEPAVAGAPMTIQYRLEDGSLPGDTNPVYAHVGYNGWNPVLPDIAMTFDSDSLAWQTVLTLPQSTTQVDVVFNDGAGNWDNNSGMDWHFTVEGGGGPSGWEMDGSLDEGAELIASADDLSLWAGWDGEQLYLASTAAIAGLDHFILLDASGTTTQASPWGKAGTVPSWEAFMAVESDNGWCGWFDNEAAAQIQHGSIFEGVIDPATEWGSLPSEVHLALLAYATEDGGALTAQVPAGNGDGNLTENEWVSFELTSTPSAPPMAVDDLHIARLGNAINLTWSAVVLDTQGQPHVANAYLIQRRYLNSATWTTVDSIAATQWSTMDLDPQEQFFRVVAIYNE